MSHERKTTAAPVGLRPRLGVFPAVALISLLGLLFFTELVLQPSAVLYSDQSDLIPFHLASKRFLARSWQETGELPLWCPYIYAGMPFLHDIQVSAFYPPHWPLLWLAEERQGAALSWLVVLHVIAAGVCMYAYARHQGLDTGGSLVAALGYMFAGKWLLHILIGGHYNDVPLAWLPLALLWLEQAIEKRSVLRATAAGAVYSLFLLGAYPYVTLHAGLFIALWTLGTTLENAGVWSSEKPKRSVIAAALGRWLGLGVWTVVVAVLLAAVQLLPSLELARYASRNLGVAFSPKEALDNGLRTLVGLAGTGLVTDVTWRFEDRGGFGLLWIGTAVLAPLVDPRPKVRFQFAATVIWFTLALTGAYVFQFLPGFHFFRIPSRMLLIAALPVALLSATTVQALVRQTIAGEALSRCRQRFVKVVVLLSLLPVVQAVAVSVHGYALQLPLYWIGALVLVPAAWWLLGTARLTQAQRSWLWTILLLLDVVLLARPAVQVRTDQDIFTPSASARYVAEHAGEHGRAYAAQRRQRDPETGAFVEEAAELSSAATPLWPDFPMGLQIEALGGFNPIDVLRTKEYLQMLCGRNEPLQALQGPLTGPLLGELVFAQPGLADLLGVRYLLLPASTPLEALVPDAQARRHWHAVLHDPGPMTFNFIPRVVPKVPQSLLGADCGYFQLPPYTVYENANVLPRAFVVAEAAALPERSRVFDALKTTDFRRRVLLEGWNGDPQGKSEPSEPAKATIREYLPNRVVIDVDSAASGFLVLTDVWFPGWQCTVDDQPREVYRANFLFRAVEVPAGTHRVVFTFAPPSYTWGRTISASAAAGLLLLGLIAAARAVWRRAKKVAL
jgi:hypothetical protein